MANEFIARKGIIVLANGITATGSVDVTNDVNIEQDLFVAGTSNLHSTNITGSLDVSGSDAVTFTTTNDFDVVAGDTSFNLSGEFFVGATDGVFLSSSTGTDITGKLTVSDVTTFNGPVTASAGVTGSFTGSFKGDGSQLTGLVTDLRVSGSTGNDTISLLTDDLSILGSNGITTTVTDNTVTVNLPQGTVTSSVQVDHDATTNFVSNEHIDHSTVNVGAGNGLSGGGTITSSLTVTLDTGSTHFTSGVVGALPTGTVSSSTQVTTLLPVGTVSASSQVDHDQTTNFVSDEHIDHSTVNISAGSGLLGGGDITTSRTLTLDTGSAHFLTGVKQKLDNDNVISSSAQVIASGITGIDQFAQLTGSNDFTAINTFSNTTNSTDYTNGAVVIAGGLGVAQDVNISGSLTVEGLLTVISMSTQYVTSSQYTVGTSRIILNDDDLVRFGGITVIDSGSTPASASLLWDSLRNHFIYETDDIHNGNVDPHSALLIAGPETYDVPGNEIGLVEYRVPVATSDHNIDNRPESSSIRIDPTTRLTHIEHGLNVTGSVSSSVGFWGDGSNLTGIVTTLAFTGSNDGVNAPSSINLKTEGLVVSASEGIDVSVSGQTITIAGEDASTTNKGIAAFNSTNFTVVNGAVSASNITINGTGVTLGGTRNITLQEITTAGSSTADQVTLGGGAIIHGVLFTSSSVTSIASPVANQVVATVPVASYDSAHFDYVIKDGTNYRTGTVMAVWDGTSVEFTDTSTNDIGTTLGQLFAVDISGASVRLKFTSDVGTWTVKTAIRAL